MADVRIESEDFALVSGYRVEHDGGDRGVLDAQDEVRTPEGRVPSWGDAHYKDARNAYVDERIVRPALSAVEALTPTLRLNCSNRPEYQQQHKPLALAHAKAVKSVTEDASLSASVRADGYRALAQLQTYVASTEFDVTLLLSAIENAHRSITLDPNDATAWSNYGETGLLIDRKGLLARWYVRKKTRLDAGAMMTRSIIALQKFPDDPRAQAMLEMVLAQTGGHDALLSRVRTHVEVMRRDPESRAIIDAARAEVESAVRGETSCDG